jgi:hypothetical protein
LRGIGLGTTRSQTRICPQSKATSITSVNGASWPTWLKSLTAFAAQRTQTTTPASVAHLARLFRACSTLSLIEARRRAEVNSILSSVSIVGAPHLSMLRDSDSANCSVNLSVSTNGDDDHDDTEGATTGMGPDPRLRVDHGPGRQRHHDLRQRPAPAGRLRSEPAGPHGA